LAAREYVPAEELAELPQNEIDQHSSFATSDTPSVLALSMQRASVAVESIAFTWRCCVVCAVG
jgi:hypothetical protein